MARGYVPSTHGLPTLWTQQRQCKGLTHRSCPCSAGGTMDADRMALESGGELHCRQEGLVETMTLELLLSVRPLSSLVAQRKPLNFFVLT